MDTGQYFAALLINNSSARISNQALFSVEEGSSGFNGYGLENEFMVYPSPTDGMVKLKIPVASHNEVSIQIISMGGKVIFEREFQTRTSENYRDLDLSGNAPGFYIVRLKSGSLALSRKLVIK